MKIVIQGTKLYLTKALSVYIEEKLGTLQKFLKRYDAKGSVILRVQVARASRHHKKGDVFYAEANLDIPGIVIRAEAYHRDARLAVNLMKKTLEAEIKKHNDKLKQKRR